MPKWLFWCLVSALFWGAWGVVSKAAADAVPPLQNQVLFTLGLLPPVGVAVCLWWHGAGGFDRRGVAFGFLTGLIGGLGNLALFASLSRGGKASIVFPFTALYPLITVVMAALVLRERVNRVQVLGVAAALAAILILSAEPASLSEGRALGLQMLAQSWTGFALVALFFWGFTGITQKLSTNTLSAETSFLAFAAAFLPLAGLILVFEPMSWVLPAKAWFWAVLGGALNGFGSLTSFAAYRLGGKASIVTPLAALYPVFTVLLAVPLLGERIGWREVLGIALAVAAGPALAHESAPAEARQASECPTK